MLAESCQILFYEWSLQQQKTAIEQSIEHLVCD